VADEASGDGDLGKRDHREDARDRDLGKRDHREDARGGEEPRRDKSDGDTPPFPVDAATMAVLETLWQHGHAAYLVGGGVRDALLGRPVADWDVATDATPERILEIFPDGNYQNRFGTVQAQGLEITTFRREHRYADHRRPDSVTFSDDIYEDLARRDLTINAIAWGRRGRGSPARSVDPADGRRDLEARLVRAVGDPRQRFDEDALRLLRAIRIAASLGFSIEPITLGAIRSHASDIGWVSEERVAAEVRRMLVADRPSRAFHLLRETGILAHVLPELDALAEGHGSGSQIGVEPDVQDSLERTLHTLDVVAATAPGHERLALAALLAATGATSARTALDRLRVASRDADAVVTLIEAARTPYAVEWRDADVRRFMAGVPAELLDDVLVLRQARTADDAAAAGLERHLSERIRGQRAAGAPLSLAELAVDGRDLRERLGIPEGPLIGRILDRLLQEVIEQPTLDQEATLLTRASLIRDELRDEFADAGRSASRPARKE
jgi:tRNA nucleotidyltransferase/poly(A) polymerase